MKKPVVEQLLLFRIKKIILFQLVLAFVFSNELMAKNENESDKKNSSISVTKLFVTIEKSNPKLLVKGKVSDERGNPLPGASILVKGTKIATITDADGNFSIDAPSDNGILVISYIGLETQEVNITDKEILVVLLESGQKLKEVVINTGYEKTSRRTFTGAVSLITEKDLKTQGISDVSRMIEGKATGVTVQNVTGSFGTAPKITVRGSSSIFGNTQPLWVVDGVVLEDIVNLNVSDLASGDSATLLSSAIAGLNPNDVLSLEILKDASATSIYGSKSLNGVVVVTTKRGRREVPLTVNYSLEQTVRPVPNYNQYDILNSQETMSILKEMEYKGFLDLPTTSQGRYGGVYNILANAINTYDVTSGSFGVKNDVPSRNAFLKKYELANTDWFNVLFKPSISQNHFLSLSGGGKNSTYYGSIGYFKDPGWTIADEVSQLTSNLKTTFFINDKLTFGLSAQTSIRNQKAPGSFDSKEDKVNGSVTRDFDINPFNYALNTNRTLRPYDDFGNLEYYRNNWAPINILNELKNNYMDIDVLDLRLQADLGYKINSNLTYNFIGNIRYANSTREHNITENSNIVGAYNAQETTIVRNENIFLYQDPENLTAPKISVLPNGGIRRKFTNNLVTYDIRNSVNYKKTLNGVHELEGLAGVEIRSVDRKSDDFTAYGLQYDRGLTPFTDPRIIEKIINEGGSYFGTNEQRERAVGFFSKIGYTYDRRYTGTLTGRYDGSNRQGNSDSSRWLPTYTIGGKWNIKEESFLKDNNTISNLGLRASYGLTATAGPATNSLAIYSSSISDRLNVSDRENGLNINELQNNDLTWEKQFETNIGIDLALFDNRIQVTADVYKRNAFDLVDYVTTSGIGGQQFKQGNNADMTTKGFEFAITTQNLVNSKLKWSTTLNFSIYEQEITKLQNNPSVLGLVNGSGGNTIGHPRNSLYSYQFTGLNDQGLPTFVMADGITDNVSGANFQDLKNVTDYLKFEGSIEPNKTAGFANTFTYENWSLNVFIVASGGNVIRLNPIYSSKYDDLTVFTKDFTNRWINPGDEAVTNIPVIADKRLIANYAAESKELARAYNAYNFSDQRVADGTFVRMKNITLGYEFPKQLKNNLKLSNFSLKGTATNPFLIYADKNLNGQDPEFFRSGGVSLPISAQYTFAINVGF
jgi:TonB-linked SusC/RagA family outer membrane protein